MATRNEKIVGSLIGFIIGAILGNERFKSQNLPDEERWKCLLGGGVLGTASGYGLASVFGSPNNTVNYTHYNKRKRVYEGITYADRFEQRMAEHKSDGKVFTRVIKDYPKPRVEALKLERERIIRFNPVNNIQHNSIR